jgi:VIT1/CCC1 family predicted Fe2+/Mn2+ transporter
LTICWPGNVIGWPLISSCNFAKAIIEPANEIEPIRAERTVEMFSIALATHDTRYAFIAGLATALGAAVSMGFSEGLSDTGEFTGRGSPFARGTITGVGTFVGGILHTLPFLIPHYRTALLFAVAVVAFELLALAYLRWRFFADTFLRALGIVTFAGVIIAAVSAGLGSVLGAPTG